MGKKKQAKSLTATDKLAKKDEKAKKTYALSKSEASTSHRYDTDDQPKVVIPDRLEQEIIEMILEHQQGDKYRGDVSKRLSTKKLTDLYNNLSDAGFSQKQIEAAMNNTVAHGGDLISALDWLCLNTKNDELPEGFSQTLLREEQKRRPQFDASLQALPPTTGPATSSEAQSIATAEEAVGKSDKSVAPEQKSSMKDWILNYAEFSDDSEEEQEETEEDPNERYLTMTAKLLDAKSQAAQAKQDANKTQQKELSKKIRDIRREMDSLELEPGFNPAVKIKDIDQEKMGASGSSQSKGSSSQNDTSDSSRAASSQSTASKCETSKSAEGDVFNLSGFAAMEEKATVADTPVKAPVKEVKLDVRNFEYTRQQWTGKSPKQFLIDWVRKHLPPSDPPKFDKKQHKQKWRSICKVDRKKDGGMLSVTPEILCENNMESQHLAATLALYHLCPGQPIHQLLPPPYRDVWLEWRDADNAVKQEAKEKENKPRDQFIARFLRKVQMEDKKVRPAMVKVSERNDEEMTWEDLADEVSSLLSNRTILAHIQAKRPSSSHASKLDSSALKQLFKDRMSSQVYQTLQDTRRKLPVFQHREKVMERINRENVVVVAGETGSGKSTQIPQFVLEESIMSGAGSQCNIVCTQPRRISAVSLAKRVSEELGERNPGHKQSLCGYQIRFESKKGPNTKLTYCTTGVLLRQLQQDPLMSHITHIIIDEVHERSVQSDFLMIVVKEILNQRRDLKVILMSATLDSEKFSAYFSHCQVISIPGRTFPVEVYHLEDVIETIGYVVDEDSPYTLKSGQLVEEESATLEVTEKGGDSSQVDVYWTKQDITKIDMTDLSADQYSLKTRNAVTRLNMKRINMDLIMEILRHLDKKQPFCSVDGSVLVFLPGLSDIQELHENLQADRHFSDKARYRVLALHSVLSSTDQSEAFTVPPPGVRKIVIATNIAETGITIPDVVFVIDAGKAKENRYIESSQMSSLEEVFISKANAKQRQGRAGRVQEGFCFRLYTKQMYENFRPFTVPELLRVPLEELCLNIMKCKFGKPVEFLCRAMDPPQSVVVSRALTLLQDVGACDLEGGSLTPLGHHLAALPVHVRIGKMLIFASIFGCLEQVAVIAASMTEKSPFVVPLGKRDLADTAKRAMSIACSDHLTVYKAFEGWVSARSQGRQAEHSYCSHNFLKRNTLMDIENVKNDLVKLVTSIGFENITMSSVRRPTGKRPDVLDISSSTTIDQGLNSDTIAVVRAVITAGLYPSVAKISFTPAVDAAANPEKIVCLAETSQGIAQIHPSSVNRFLQANGWLVYLEKVKLSRVYLRDSTLTSSYPLMLFGGDMDVQHTQQAVSIDTWIQFKAKAKTGVIFKELRYLLADMLQKKLEEPALDLKEDKLIPLIRRLITAEKT
ncbi:LOW QUALITY PROTEIN: ATP-dependent RNA helicase dhx29-like [Haliotis rubra]|uniref:LOW QUALITY PROTEIN: ATP-dependent RNA helicase dhx29-like n=1 Tax=Haliotis rubra TaxID=36100 RepID=UPI001EE5CD9D|nr:LOW QUALITY PROTEIN: ATP-dependent RNA helicase dhx29-like [Haliotis rubra]